MDKRLWELLKDYINSLIDYKLESDESDNKFLKKKTVEHLNERIEKYIEETNLKKFSKKHH